MNRKYMIAVIVLMVVGFAAVSTSLFVNGSTNIIGKKDDFKVYYSDAKVNGVQDLSIVESETSLRFSTELDTLGQTYVIEYDVTNSSKNYDADLEMVCTGGDEYLSVVNSFDDVTNLAATETRVGTLTLTLAKTYTGADYDVDINCTITANAVERTSLGTGTPKDPVKVCKWEYEDIDESGSLTVGDRYGYCDDQFYVINVDNDNVEMITAYSVDADGTTPAMSYYLYAWSGDVIDGYTNHVKELTGDDSITSRLITLDDLSSLGCEGINDGAISNDSTCANTPYPEWLLTDDMWTESVIGKSVEGYTTMAVVFYDGTVAEVIAAGGHAEAAGIKPVLKVSRDTLNTLTNTNPLLNAQTFCESKGYLYGMERASTYSLGFSESGDINDAYYLCANDEDFACDLYGFDLNGTKVYSLDGGCTAEQ